MDDVKTLLKRHEQLCQRRLNWVTWWQEIALRVMPSSATFTVDGPEGTKRIERQYSGRPVLNNEKFGAVMDDLLTPRNQEYHGLAPEDEELIEDQAVKVYLERVNKLLFAQRYRPEANFAAQKSQGYLSLGGFGNSCMFIGEDVGIGTHYITIPLKQLTWAQNHQGVIDTIYRCYPMEARNIVRQFGEKNVSPKVAKAMASGKEFEEFEVLHCTWPNEEMVAGRKDYRGMPWASRYILVEEKHTLLEHGYAAWPFSIGRYMLAPNEIYARSPAMACWGAILTLNEEKKTVLRSGQANVEPPLLLADDGSLDSFNMRGRALNYGTLTQDGTPLVQPLKVGGDVPLGLELMQLEHQEIDDAFLVGLYNMLQDENIKTATQAQEVIRQKAVFLAPMMGRQESEDLGPLVAREIQVAASQTKNAWIMTEMPDALRERGGRIKVHYTSPWARAMRAADAVAISRSFEALAQAIQIDPKSAFVLDVPGGLREFSNIIGMPAKLVRDQKLADQLSSNHDDAMAVQQAAAVAPNLSQSVLNVAKAEQLRGGAAA